VLADKGAPDLTLKLPDNWRRLILGAFAAVCVGLAGCTTPPAPPPPATLPATTRPPEVTDAPGETPLPTEPPSTPTLSAAELTFDGDVAMEHVEAQMAIGPRPAGSEASRLTAEYILSTLAELGWETEARPFTYQGVEAQNLVARAGQPEGPVYMFGAHYDTRREADQDPDMPDAPVPGANDGASGVAVLLELARVVDLTSVEGQVWLVFFDAEDNGNLDGWEYIAGSRHFVEEMEVVPEYFVLVDMVGDADQQLLLERNSDPVLQALLWEIASELGYADSFIAEPGYSMIDDHTPFLEKGIPAVDIIDFDYPYWHTTEDTIDKVSAESLERVGRVLETFIERGGVYPAR